MDRSRLLSLADVVPSGFDAVVGSLIRKDAVGCLVKYLTVLQEQGRKDLGQVPFRVNLKRPILCLRCNTVSSQVPHNVIPKTGHPPKGCSVCAGNSREESERKYLEKLKEQGRRDEDSRPYSCHGVRNIRCLACSQVTEQTPHNVISGGSGCGFCSGRSTASSVAKFLETLEEQGRDDRGGLYDSQAPRLIHCRHCNRDYSQIPRNVIIRGDTCPYCSPKSAVQLELAEYVRSLIPDEEVRSDDRSVLGGREIDVYVPSRSVALEFNGLLWHSSWCPNYVRNKERDKAAVCAGLGLKFFMIYEDEWRDKQDLVKAMVRWRLGCFNGTYVNARDTDVVPLNPGQVVEFLNRNHLDGYAQCTEAFGLSLRGQVVAVATTRRNFGGDLEIARFATDYDYCVRGGAGKLISAIKDDIGQSQLVSYSNNRLGCGELYRGLGFREETRTNAPSYYYTDGRTVRVWRWRCRRINTPDILSRYPTEEAQARAGVFSQKIFGDSRPLYRIEDCGHRRWVLP